MNVKLLRQIQKHIWANPKELDMDVVAKNIEGATFAKKFKPGAPCGTACCIDGFAQMFSGRIKPGLPDRAGHLMFPVVYDPDFAVGAEILELTPAQAERLFEPPSDTVDDEDAIGWPQEYAMAYVQAVEDGDYIEAAQITFDRIEHFIQTEGRE